ncbi:MAG: TAXI family TRAP transporter solute-binding subunit [Pseudomonadota bacterium]
MHVLGSGQLLAAEPHRYILATATTGGTYYPVGIALSTLTKVRLEPSHNIVLIDVSSAGSGENIRMLRDNTAQFAILQGLYGAWAWNGAGGLHQDGPQTYLRSITMLWQNVEHFIIKSDFVKTGDMSDLAALREKRLSLGQINSGTEGSGLYILERLGFAGKDFQSKSIDYGSNAAAIQNGTIDGMNIPGGLPVSAVTQAFATLGKDITVLSFTEEQLTAVNSVYPLWNRYLIPAGTYPGQDQQIATIAQPNFLAVRSDVDDQVVYLIVKAIYQNLPLLRIIHPATEAMALDKAIEGLPVPLHPGAARFYREQGIDIPDQLIAR